MYDNIDIFHDIVENVRGGKVTSNYHEEQIPVFCSASFHLAGFRLGPPRSSDLDPAFKEKVYDVGAHKACGACDENMTEKGWFFRQYLSYLRTMIPTEE